METSEAIRYKLMKGLLDHFCDKNKDGFIAQMFFPFGQAAGSVRRGPTDGTYQLLNVRTQNGRGQKGPEFDSMFFTADIVLALQVVEEGPKIISPTIDQVMGLRPKE